METLQFLSQYFVDPFEIASQTRLLQIVMSSERESVKVS